MLKYDCKYVWQLLNANNGVRSEPVTADLGEFCVYLNEAYNGDETTMVLLLVELEADDPHQFVMRFPLMRVPTFLRYVNNLEMSHV